MRHRHGRRKLNITDGAHRRSLMRHVCNALILREQINTTLPRAKELRRFVEPLITLGKRPSIHRRRLAFSRLQDKKSVAKLFGDLGVRFGSRPGGYVRILKNGFRKGDNAPMAMVEFVEKPPPVSELPDAKKPGAKKKKKSAAKTAKAKSAQAAKTESADAAEDKNSAPSAATAGENSTAAVSDSSAAESNDSAKTAAAKVAESAVEDSAGDSSAKDSKTESADSASDSQDASAEDGAKK